ncbi:MAG: hypothetical protein HY695_35305 [Deltaproteobacteria bacterium]|nr:hypothetical protein [Deltaproteobacteria bacterium]
MSALDPFEKWAELARLEHAPQPDVVPSVLRDLKSAAIAPENPATGVWAFVLASAFAAVACAWLGHDAWLALLGNWYSWIQDFTLWSSI